jgi:hypothetical protein
MITVSATSKQNLVDLVIEQIKEDISRNTLLNLDGLLWDVSEGNLVEYLSDERLQEFRNNQVS